MARFGAVLTVLIACAPGCGRVSFEPQQSSDAESGGIECFEPASDTAAGLSIDNFSLQFATPNSLRVRWTPTWASGGFSHYELYVRKLGAECDVLRYTAEQNPGLAHYTSPEVGHVLDATFLDGLEPDTDYEVQLRAADEAGGQVVTAPIQARTSPAPTGQVLLFADEDTPGYSIPSAFALSAGEGYAGTHKYEFVSACEPSCYENLRRQGLGLDTSSLTPENFESAYYEFAVSTAGSDHSYWSQARLSFEQVDGSRVLFIQAPFVISASGNYRLYQIPLSSFESEVQGERLTYDGARFAVHEFTVGGWWPLGATVHVDELRIRW